MSSALGKALGKQAVAGDVTVLPEAVDLLSHHCELVCARAAKIIKQATLADPSFVAGYATRLLPAPEVPESQTHRMVRHTLGLCAELDTYAAARALLGAGQYVKEDKRAFLWGATHRSR